MIDFRQVLKDFDGVPVIEADNAVTLKAVVVRALISTFEDERHLKAEEKFERGDLASRIHRSEGPLALKVEEIATVKKLVGKAFGAAIVWAAWPLLDAAETAKD